jgi:hypothetical protein
VRYSHFAHIPDPGVYRRKLTREQAERVVRMKDERGLSWSSIAAWFTRNGTPIDYGTARNTYHRVRREA